MPKSVYTFSLQSARKDKDGERLIQSADLTDMDSVYNMTMQRHIFQDEHTSHPTLCLSKEDIEMLGGFSTNFTFDTACFNKSGSLTGKVYPNVLTLFVNIVSFDIIVTVKLKTSSTSLCLSKHTYSYSKVYLMRKLLHVRLSNSIFI